VLIHILSRIPLFKNYKLAAAHLVKAFLVSCGKTSFITVLIKSHGFSLSRAKLVQSTHTKILILSSFVATFPKSVHPLSDVGHQAGN
jgi:hypothetical protein